MFFEVAVISGGAVMWNKFRPQHITLMDKLTENKAHSPSKTMQLARDIKTSIWGDDRQQLHLRLDPSIKADFDKRSQQEIHRLKLFIGATSLALAAMIYPAFYWVGSIAVLYLARHTFQLAWTDLRKNRLVSVPLINTILIVGMIASGQLILAAVAGIMGGLVARVIRKAEETSQKQLINVFSGHPSRVWIEQDGLEIQVPFESIRENDIVVVNAGEIIPADGIIERGSANIDQHILTGESQPVDKGVGEKVYAATLVLVGRIHILVETAGEKTVAANIGHILNNTTNYKDNLTLRGKKIADSLMPVELIIAAITLGILGPMPAMAVLWSGLGLRMIVFGPITVLNYLQILARQGILVKDGRILESFRQVDTVVFDKTGTLTMEQPIVKRIHLLSWCDESQILFYAASAEYRQTHPIARAIIDRAKHENIGLSVPDSSNVQVGYGIKVQLKQQVVHVGSARFMAREGISVLSHLMDLQEQASSKGFSLVCVSVDSQVVGAMEVEPSVRPEAQGVIEFLRQQKISTYVISGDHNEPTRNVADRLGIDHFFAETLPEDKAKIIQRLREEGKFVCYIGDGINDAIALKSSEISISLKGASSAATDTAQIIFMDGTLNSLSKLFQVSKEFEGTMQNNFRISIVPGIINISCIYIFNFGIAASMGLFYAGTMAGLANTTMPLITHRETHDNKASDAEHMIVE